MLIDVQRCPFYRPYSHYSSIVNETPHAWERTISCYHRRLATSISLAALLHEKSLPCNRAEDHFSRNISLCNTFQVFDLGSKTCNAKWQIFSKSMRVTWSAILLTNSTHLYRGLTYTDRVSSWTFGFHPYTENCLQDLLGNKPHWCFLF